MQVFIAEKPSVAQAIANEFPGRKIKRPGYIEIGDIYITWCIGHLLEQAEPHEYDVRYKKWSISDLPISPEKWILKVNKKTQEQFFHVKSLLNKAKSVVHVGDPDRVGQILVDEILHFVNLPKSTKVQRCLISDLNPESIQKALKNLRDNKEFVSLSISALARMRADWLYGINMTRLCTLYSSRYRFKKGVLSIGRVQTPVLGLIVKRYLEIINFISKDFYELQVNFKTGFGEIYKAKWKPSEACFPYMDADNRVVNKALVELVQNKITNQEGIIESIEENEKYTSQPLPYNLSALQIDASIYFGINAQDTLQIAQALYETYKVTTYPRSDCRYIPEEHFKDSQNIINSIQKVIPRLESFCKDTDLKIKTKAWNTKKVSAHHAIIPTLKTGVKFQKENEKKIYELICRRYLMQFYPKYRYSETKIETKVLTGSFISKGISILDIGFKVLYTSFSNSQKDIILPNLKKGDIVCFENSDLVIKKTTPPKNFTDASLISAMTGIGRYVESSEIKKILNSTNGLGTEATRASIIEILFKRGFILREGKSILPTKLGIAFISCLPNEMVIPDMTALWEANLEKIYKKEMTYAEFMNNLNIYMLELLSKVDYRKFISLSKLD
ncbi:MAG: DNA topoisomerase III [Psittacicella sp.]